MGRVHKLLIRSCLRGILIGWTLLAIGLAFNVLGMREIIWTSSDRILAIFLLMVGFAITFGNASMGYAMMSIPKAKTKEEI